MRDKKKRSRNDASRGSLKAKRMLIIASLCLGLFLFGPHYQSVDTISITAEPALAQDSTASDTAEDDTPSEQDIADFASEYDKDGDGEIDEFEDEEEEAEDDEPEQDEADEADEADDADEADAGDESDDQDRENQYDDDDDGEISLDEDSEDTAHSGKNRDDIDGEASPEYRLSGYDRYSVEGSLRRLGSSTELTPLIEREERILLEN